MGLKKLSNTTTYTRKLSEQQPIIRLNAKKNTFPDHHQFKKASSMVIRRKLAFKRFKEARLLVPSCRFMVM